MRHERLVDSWFAGTACAGLRFYISGKGGAIKNRARIEPQRQAVEIFLGKIPSLRVAWAPTGCASVCASVVYTNVAFGPSHDTRVSRPSDEFTWLTSCRQPQRATSCDSTSEISRRSRSVRKACAGARLRSDRVHPNLKELEACVGVSVRVGMRDLDEAQVA